MKIEKNSRIIIIIILFIGVFCISIGFAAFSKVLKIESSVSVNPLSTAFSVAFSSTTTAGNTSAPICTTTGNGSVDTSKISITGTQISGLNSIVSEQGDSIKCTFYVHNTGAYTAYLNHIKFNNVEGKSQNKVCTAISGTTQSSVDDACDEIRLTLKVASKSIINGTGTQSFSGISLKMGSYHTVEVEIDYYGSGFANGDFKLQYGTIELQYSTVDS